MTTMKGSVIEPNKGINKVIDREKICPMMLRVFCSTGRHNLCSDYMRGSTPSSELQIYTWMDATLKELTNLVMEVNLGARKKGTFFDFSIVYPDMRSTQYRMREIGATCSGRKGIDDNVSLANKNFEIGEYLDVAISVPTRR